MNPEPCTDESPVLALSGLHAHYGGSHVLRGVSLQVRSGEVASLLGRNGAGRSTLLKAAMGLVAPTAGEVSLSGRNVAGLPAHEISRLGMAYVPESRDVFASLTVEQNLELGMQPARPGRHGWTRSQVFDYFPRLKARRHTRAGSLSGGEQQMLALSRALLGNPRVLLVDEPTEGLAPPVVQAVKELLEDVCRAGVAVLLVEQKLVIALEISSRVFLMGHGRVVFEGRPAELAAQPLLAQDWLAV